MQKSTSLAKIVLHKLSSSYFLLLVNSILLGSLPNISSINLILMKEYDKELLFLSLLLLLTLFLALYLRLQFFNGNKLC